MCLSLDAARTIAADAAKRRLAGHLEEEPVKWLADEVFEAPHCWLFLRAADIKMHGGGCLYGGRLDACLPRNMAFVVSKKTGNISYVADHYRDPEALRQYVLLMSDNVDKWDRSNPKGRGRPIE
jgi:hypothetical protein